MANEGSITINYDVFLSFRGENTRNSFAGNLCYALRMKRLRVFMDNSGLKSGDQVDISASLKAIEASRMSIVVLSKFYASSTWCLDELVKIIECKNNQCVVPIYYNVDPTDVRDLKNTYGAAMARHGDEGNYELERLKKWCSALNEIADTSQCPFQFQKGEQYEYEFIERIVEYVTNHEALHRYDIVLSFGKDIRYSFAGFLSDALRAAGFKIFANTDYAENQTSQLSEAIQKSRLSIIVFSENYADSSPCLDELLTILENMKKMKNYLVWPIFYKVEPSDLRHQRNSYGKAMTVHENVFPEKVHKWRLALSQVANLKGWHLRTGYEYEFIEKVVEIALKI